MLLLTPSALGAALPPSLPPSPLPAAPPVATPPSEEGPPLLLPQGKQSHTGIILAIAIPPAVSLLVIAVLLGCFFHLKKRKQHPQPDAVHSENDWRFDSLVVDIFTVRAATENFAERNKLGSGGSGIVYKGVLPDGQEVAVKRLLRSSNRGMNELKNELVLVAKLQHKNLVRLLGVCLDEQEMMLVYEYMPNKSLDSILFDPDKRGQLDWRRRYKIISGIARGLQYLHEESQLKIIHRDLKGSNILLDADMNPKISDFGLARLFGSEQTQDVTSRVVGTFGYMAPEYAMRGHYSVKSDAFSFGVLVLEIVTGKKNTESLVGFDSDDLLTLVWDHWSRSTVPEIFDPSIAGHCSMNQVLRCVHIGMLCVQENPADRPAMSAVTVMLSSETVSLGTPSRPAFCLTKSGGTTGGDSGPSQEYPESVSVNDVTITEIESR